MQAACGAVASLADGSCPAQALEPHLDALLSSLLPDLQHQHSRVRLEALGALNSLVLKGLRCQALQERVAPAVQPLVHDHAVSVRTALFASAAAWMGCRQQSGMPLPSLDSPLAGQFRLEGRQYASFLWLFAKCALMCCSHYGSCIE